MKHTLTLLFCTVIFASNTMLFSGGDDAGGIEMDVIRPIAEKRPILYIEAGSWLHAAVSAGDLSLIKGLVEIGTRKDFVGFRYWRPWWSSTGCEHDYGVLDWAEKYRKFWEKRRNAAEVEKYKAIKRYLKEQGFRYTHYGVYNRTLGLPNGWGDTESFYEGLKSLAGERPAELVELRSRVKEALQGCEWWSSTRDKV